MADASCFKGRSVTELLVGSMIITGITVSYIPQFYSIFARRSSEGVSALTMWLSFICSYLTFINALMLGWDLVECCRYLSFGQVLEELLPLMQLIVGPVALFFLFMCVVYFFDITPTEQRSRALKLQDQFNARLMLTLNFVGVVVLALSAVFFIAFVGHGNYTYTGYADALGLISSIIIGFVWLPQIYLTFRAKDTGQLSIVMLLVQGPGNVFLICSLAWAGYGWSTWLPYVITTFEQLTLIVMWIWYKWVRPHGKHHARLTLDNGDNEPVVAEFSGMDTAASLAPYLQLPTDDGLAITDSGTYRRSTRVSFEDDDDDDEERRTRLTAARSGIN